ncbi:MAG: hypothetical protein HC895_13475 [Leptolyngbyaceae cyanobacterium SM1_3_5]|nr:hypothetical protein [Leptolyngbyaceae cyanobacterium SM1_3_5]
MTIEYTGANSFISFRNLTKRLPWRSKRQKLHDYTTDQNGVDYVFDRVNGGTQGCLTAQGGNPQVGDQVVLKLDEVVEKYEIATLDRYATPPDLWTALLVKIK